MKKMNSINSGYSLKLFLNASQLRELNIKKGKIEPIINLLI